MITEKKTVTFTVRPSPIFPSYRPMLRIGQILLTLKVNSNGGKASLLKLHLFSWGYKELKNLRAIKDFVESNYTSKIYFFGIEPTLNRALSLAVYEELIGFNMGRYYLKEKGESFVKKILSDKELFIEEKQLLGIVGKKVNEGLITQLQKFWNNAES